MVGRNFLAGALLVMCGALVTVPLNVSLGASDEPLVVDLLPQKIEVDSSFTGSTVILFGVKTQPGDIIVTGTPSGAGARFDPPKYLKPGDEIEVEAEGIGILKNGVADEK